MLKALKIRIYPNKEQQLFLNGQFGAVRMVYNKGLHIISHYYKLHKKKLNIRRDIQRLLPIAKKSTKYSWLKDYDSLALQGALLNLQKAFDNFFKKRAKYPHFKKKHGVQSSYHATTIEVGDSYIRIPKLQSIIKAKVHRTIEGKLKSITLKKTNTNKYYAALLFEVEEVNLNTAEKTNDIDIDKIIALDMGINTLLANSNGMKVENPRFLNKATRNLRRKQKQLSRKKKGSAKRAKARLMLAKCHEKLKDVRNDFQHKLSRQIVDENQAIIVETLKVKNMMKNKKIAKHIADASWSMFVDKIRYKAIEKKKSFIAIDQWFASSKTCSNCLYKKTDLSLSIREWTCISCNTHHDRDINAALNIKSQGINILKAEGFSVSAS